MSVLNKRNILVLIIGIFLDATGVALLARSDFGISAVSSVAYTLSRLFPTLTFGVWSYLYQFALFVLMCVLVRKCTVSYVCSFLIGVIFGYTLDFCSYFVNMLPFLFGVRLTCFVAGTVILIVGVSFLMISNMPIMPQDLFTREIHQYFGFPFKRVKITFDLSCVAISLVLALVVEKRVIGIGVGTIVNALIVGKCVDRVKKFLVDKILAFT